MIAGVCGLAGVACAVPPAVTVEQITSGASWGYRGGVKQPVGSYLDGISIHLLSRASDPFSGEGSPDYLLWVNENTGEHGIIEQVTGAFAGQAVNPGGMATFGADGTIWLTHGAHLPQNPMKLFHSDAPFVLDSFTEVVSAFIDEPSGSTTPCVIADDDRVVIYWRHGPSTGRYTQIRGRVYNPNLGFVNKIAEIRIGEGDQIDPPGRVGVEQFWVRRDPRHDRTLLTWQWFNVDANTFGSNPLFASPDGLAWYRADGDRQFGLPIQFSERDAVMVSEDHIVEPGNDTNWLVGELGLTPGGVMWHALPHAIDADSFDVRFWRWNGSAWGFQTLATPMEFGLKGYAIGVTDDRMVMLFTDRTNPSDLMMRVSEDDGVSWSAAEVVDTLPAGHTVGHLSFIQPAVEYDASARFIYGYFDLNGDQAARRYRYDYRWIRVDFDPDCRADLTGSSDANDPGFGVPDGVADGEDFFYYLDAFVAQQRGVCDLTGSSDPNAGDFDTPDGDCDADDFFRYLDLFTQGC